VLAAQHGTAGKENPKKKEGRKGGRKGREIGKGREGIRKIRRRWRKTARRPLEWAAEGGVLSSAAARPAAPVRGRCSVRCPVVSSCSRPRPAGCARRAANRQREPAGSGWLGVAGPDAGPPPGWIPLVYLRPAPPGLLPTLADRAASWPRADRPARSSPSPLRAGRSSPVLSSYAPGDSNPEPSD
jgi:hypothetical protein